MVPPPTCKKRVKSIHFRRTKMRERPKKAACSGDSCHSLIQCAMFVCLRRRADLVCLESACRRESPWRYNEAFQTAGTPLSACTRHGQATAADRLRTHRPRAPVWMLGFRNFIRHSGDDCQSPLRKDESVNHTWQLRQVGGLCQNFEPYLHFLLSKLNK